MRYAVIVLIAILAITHAVMAAAPLLANGSYRIYTGNSHHPPSNRYFTAKTDDRAGSVSLEPNSTSLMQVWQLHNYPNGQVSLELRGKKKYYLSEGRLGAFPGTAVGVTRTHRRWNIVKFAGGPFTRYTLTYPRQVSNKTLVVSTGTGSLDPKRIAFQNDDNPDVTTAWKFASYENLY